FLGWPRPIAGRSACRLPDCNSRYSSAPPRTRSSHRIAGRGHRRRSRWFESAAARGTDSPLEGDGFELSVLRERGHRFELSLLFMSPETDRVLSQRSTLLGAGGSKSR